VELRVELRSVLRLALVAIFIFPLENVVHGSTLADLGAFEIDLLDIISLSLQLLDDCLVDILIEFN